MGFCIWDSWASKIALWDGNKNINFKPYCYTQLSESFSLAGVFPLVFLPLRKLISLSQVQNLKCKTHTHWLQT